MILVDNRKALRIKYRELLEQLSKWDHLQKNSVEIETAKTGVPTIKVNIEGKQQYLVSKYDPVREAERLAAKYTQKDIKHVLFVGMGMGYYLKSFLEKHPEAKYSIYEPSEEILHAYLSTFRLEDLPLKNLQRLFTGINPDVIEFEVQSLLDATHNSLEVIFLPIYEKIYGEQIKGILEKALGVIEEKHINLVANVAFQKRWTINSVRNLPVMLKTPNILHNIDRSAFKGKPVIIVSAGPSLNEEFENLRYIKEHGLAYIFTVGSAINALIEHGIYPDAACTYDPQEHNYRVIQRIKDDNITDIPLIFGSSVGFETVEGYPGDLLHMIISQDTVSPFLLTNTDQSSLCVINDAPSIAIVTFQLLVKLKVSDIILVGQNLAYIKNKHYANGIDYGTGSQTISDTQLLSSICVKDVYGNVVRTTEGFNLMRQQLEMYIATNPQLKVWNTTKGGAAIDGAEFKMLTKIIAEQLTKKVVKEGWTKGQSGYNHVHLKLQLEQLKSESIILEVVLKKALDTIEAIQKAVNANRIKNLEKHYNTLDDKIGNMKKNSFYQRLLEPMIRVQQELLSQNIKGLKYETNTMKKAECIINEFGNFLESAIQNYYEVKDLFNEVGNELILSLE
ncbi:motility associated factor glycosyltransferase family protein [Sporosarcina cyprini]|uniref:motility associated factor glycosyltransferase family protein n=1 Tax=Sporosarcina cyprini TaxID=2910523 RepID=UPI001EDDD91F|nr:6-hydroxymethylpterin diphosphokinase MptE-like protein [Sporosarcina cyprini]MCG3089600.1 DUF115 domain-containing protein [Sporosarcina cyprini]